ncbi:MAG: hemerythrin domain-containing protein [Alphaproteobacteria bacterium]|nr:hemerythrin domain-containing protein [Alphaproteobacteria bacterium]
MSAVIDSIRNEHRTMARLLDLLEGQIDLFEKTDQPDYDLIREIIDYFLTFPDLYHHPKEDLVFRKLKARDAKSVEPFGELEELHEEVSERLHEFTRAVVNVLMEAEMPRDTFVSLARDFISGERAHMSAEEQHFLPVAANTLTSKDWREIEDVVSKFKDPLGADTMSHRFSLLSEKVTSWRASAAN